MNNKEIKREIQENRQARKWFTSRYGEEDVSQFMQVNKPIDVVKQATQTVKASWDKFPRSIQGDRNA